MNLQNPNPFLGKTTTSTTHPELCEQGSNSIQAFHRLVFALCLPACNCHFRIRPEFHTVAACIKISARRGGHGGHGRRSPPKWMFFFQLQILHEAMEVQVAPPPLLPRPQGPPPPGPPPPGPESLACRQEMRQPQFESMTWECEISAIWTVKMNRSRILQSIQCSEFSSLR